MLKKLATTALVVLSLSACSNGARLVRKDVSGGRVALQGAYMPAMAEARMLMVTHCKGRFQALELGESVEFQCRRATPARVAEVQIAKAGAQAQHGL